MKKGYWFLNIGFYDENKNELELENNFLNDIDRERIAKMIIEGDDRGELRQKD